MFSIINKIFNKNNFFHILLSKIFIHLQKILGHRVLDFV